MVSRVDMLLMQHCGTTPGIMQPNPQHKRPAARIADVISYTAAKLLHDGTTVHLMCHSSCGAHSVHSCLWDGTWQWTSLKCKRSMTS